jgi:uncharacterized membrane protein
METSVVINRPIEEVFAFVTDMETRPQWSSQLLQAKMTSEGPVRAGSQYRYVEQFLGRRIETAQEITVQEPPSKQGWKVTSGPFPAEGSYTFTAVEGGTRFTLAVQGEAGGFFKLAEPFLARMIKRQIDSNLSNLKDLMESGTAGTI